MVTTTTAPSSKLATSSASSLPPEELEECFICAAEDRPCNLVHGVCACHDRFMHVQCQQLMLEKSAFSDDGQGVCPVCRVQYSNVSIEYSMSLSAEGKLCVVLVLCNVLLVVCAIVELRAVRDAPTTRAYHATQPARAPSARDAPLARCPSAPQYEFGHGHCGVCLQLGLALLGEAAVGGATIAWVSSSTTLRIQTHRARCWLPGSPSDPAIKAAALAAPRGETVLL